MGVSRPFYEAVAVSPDGSLMATAASLVCLGAGKAIPTVRFAAERTARRCGGTLIRINPRDFDVPQGHVSLQAGALAGLEAIDRALAGARSG